MERVTMTSSGVLVCGGDASLSSPESVLRLLGHPVAFESGVTLSTLQDLLLRYPQLQALSPFSASFLEAFSTLEGTSPDDSTGHRLELFRTIDMQGYPGEPRVHLFLSLKVMDGETPLSLDLFSPPQLCAMPLAVGKLRHVIFGDALTSELFDTEYTLFDVLDGLLWELSFYWDKSRCGMREI